MDIDDSTVVYGGGEDGGGAIQAADYLPFVERDRPPDEFDQEFTNQVDDPSRTFFATPFKGDALKHYSLHATEPRDIAYLRAAAAEGNVSPEEVE